MRVLSVSSDYPKAMGILWDIPPCITRGQRRWVTITRNLWATTNTFSAGHMLQYPCYPLGTRLATNGAARNLTRTPWAIPGLPPKLYGLPTGYAHGLPPEPQGLHARYAHWPPMDFQRVTHG